MRHESATLTTRREFLATSATCAAHLALVGPLLPTRTRLKWGASQFPVSAQEPFGRLERLRDGVWAMVSTPLTGDYTTTCNGGIIAGRDGVAVVESFASPAGGRWIAEQARVLTGRWPTHVIVSHYHGDHAGGASGMVQDDGAPAIHATAETRDDVIRGQATNSPETRPWADVVVVPQDGPSSVDLGGSILLLEPLRGHTNSDLTVAIEGGALWCGDLVWNGMFPNYMDARPSRLKNAVASLGDEERVYVPGHGPLATASDLMRFRQVLEHVENAAREAQQQGRTAEEAAASFRLPESLGEWVLFNPAYYQRAIQAWLDES